MTQKHRVSFFVLGGLCAVWAYGLGLLAWHRLSATTVLFGIGVVGCALYAVVAFVFFWMATSADDPAPKETT